MIAELEASGAGAAPAAPQHSRPFALFVALGIFLSRIFGLVRQRVLAHYLGDSMAAGAFVAAFRIPNFLQNLFGEGVLSASFIPVYAKLLAKGDEKTAGRVAGAIASLLALVVGVLVLVGMLASPLLVSAIAPGFSGEARALTVRMVRILFPGAGLLVLSAWCLGILNSHRRFFLSYVAPVFWNLAMIATLILFGGRLGLESLAVALAWGSVAGSFLQFAIQLPTVFRVAPVIRFRMDTALEPVRQVIRNFGPVVMGRGVVQVSAFVDEIIVSFLGASSVAILGFAQTLYMLPISLFGMSIAASELPQMSSVLGTSEEVAETLRRRLAAGLRQILFLIVPTVFAFVVIGNVLVAGIYQTGRFGPESTMLVWYVLAAAALGLPAVTLGRLYSSTFYALGDTRTPLKFAVVRVAVSALLAWLLALVFRDLFVAVFGWLGLPLPEIDPAVASTVSIGVVGVVLGSSVGGWVEYLLLRRSIAIRIGAASVGGGLMVKLIIAAVAGSAAGLLSAGPFVPRVRALVTGGFGLDLLAAACAVAFVFGATYLGVAALLRVPESGALLRRLRLRR
ncbi:MAG TPA: murein biosynthesis integral membrane protein MurJ [Thermoanaerobaculia bacterium]|nr:murein biosynthesis integral membrane protein MurJ [Thermoanaerobaculia bacterium]